MYYIEDDIRPFSSSGLIVDSSLQVLAGLSLVPVGMRIESITDVIRLSSSGVALLIYTCKTTNILLVWYHQLGSGPSSKLLQLHTKLVPEMHRPTVHLRNNKQDSSPSQQSCLFCQPLPSLHQDCHRYKRCWWSTWVRYHPVKRFLLSTIT